MKKKKTGLLFILLALAWGHLGCYAVAGGITRGAMEQTRFYPVSKLQLSRANALWKAANRQNWSGTADLRGIEREGYRKACMMYLDLYRKNPYVFKWNDVNVAYQSCEMAQNFEAGLLFVKIRDRYAAEHPGEARQMPAWVEQTGRQIRSAQPLQIRKIPEAG